MKKNTLVSNSTNIYFVKSDKSLKGLSYDGLFIKNNEKFKNHCILFLTGTSTQLSDVEYFINFLVKSGYTVASIERFLGGPFHLWMNPKIEREKALKDFIQQLIESHNINKIHIIAHSYASFEVIRVLNDEPEALKKHIENIIFLNPAGFDDNIKFLSHCLRFSLIFIIKEYVNIFFNLITKESENKLPKKFYLKKFHIINSLLLKTIQNPSRTFKEVADIVSLRVKPHVKNLMSQYDYNFYFVLNTEDKLIKVSKTLHQLNGLIPKNRIIKFSGNHMDCLINKNQIQLFLNHLNRILG